MHVAGVKINKKLRREEEEMKGFEAIEKKKNLRVHICVTQIYSIFTFFIVHKVSLNVVIFQMSTKTK